MDEVVVDGQPPFRNAGEPVTTAKRTHALWLHAVKRFRRGRFDTWFDTRIDLCVRCGRTSARYFVRALGANKQCAPCADAMRSVVVIC